MNRLRLMWEAMRGPILDVFPAAPGAPTDAAEYLKAVDDIYVNDAYHSLSIEGYRVSRGSSSEYRAARGTQRATR